VVAKNPPTLGTAWGQFSHIRLYESNYLMWLFLTGESLPHALLGQKKPGKVTRSVYDAQDVNAL